MGFQNMIFQRVCTVAPNEIFMRKNRANMFSNRSPWHRIACHHVNAVWQERIPSIHTGIVAPMHEKCGHPLPLFDALLNGLLP
jgi:hypothetical protein